MFSALQSNFRIIARAGLPLIDDLAGANTLNLQIEPYKTKWISSENSDFGANLRVRIVRPESETSRSGPARYCFLRQERMTKARDSATLAT